MATLSTQAGSVTQIKTVEEWQNFIIMLHKAWQKKTKYYIVPVTELGEGILNFGHQLLVGGELIPIQNQSDSQTKTLSRGNKLEHPWIVFLTLCYTGTKYGSVN